MRLFVAVVPPAEALDHLAEFLEPRRDVEGPRWTSREQWHLTLAFMPSAPERVVEELVEELEAAVTGRSPVVLGLDGGGCFPDVPRARVLWAGVRGGESLRPLARAVRSVCSRAGASPDGGPFRAHVTLARFARPVDATRWVRVLESYEGPGWVARELVLVESHLPRERGHPPRHEVLAHLPVGR